MKPEIRILWVTDIRFDRAKGDWSQTIYNLRAIASQEIVVDVMHPPGDAKQQANFEVSIPGVAYHRNTNVGRAAELLWRSGKYAAAIARGPVIALDLARFVPKNRLIAYIYGNYFSAPDRTLNLVWKSCGQIIVQGEGQLAYIKAKGLPMDHVVAIPSVIDAQRFLSEVPVVGAIGSLYTFQCVDLCIDVVNNIRKNIPNCRLMVIGNEMTQPPSAWEDNLLRCIRGTPWIDWIPVITHEALPLVYHEMNLLLSLFDPNRDLNRPYCAHLLKTKVLEAMAAGVPVVANRSWGNRHLLGENYEYFADTVEEAVPITVQILKNASLQEKIGKELIARAAGFDLPVIGKMYAGLFRKI